MRPDQKLYVVVRADLTPGQQMAQSIHAFREFGEAYPEIEKRWFVRSNYICVLQVANADELLELRAEASKRKMRSAWFLEPAFGYSITAIAFEPTEEVSRFLADLPLAGKTV
jgi:peptidyl-tRNA hydrolase